MGLVYIFNPSYTMETSSSQLSMRETLMRQGKHLKKSLQGFTLVELIVVVTIIAILSAIGMVSFS